MDFLSLHETTSVEQTTGSALSAPRTLVLGDQGFGVRFRLGPRERGSALFIPSTRVFSYVVDKVLGGELWPRECPGTVLVRYIY